MSNKSQRAGLIIDHEVHVQFVLNQALLPA